VHVLAEEAFYSSQKEYEQQGLFECCLSTRLSKGLRVLLAPVIALPKSHRFEEISDFMMSFAENKLVLVKLQRSIDQFNQSYLIVANAEQDVVERVRLICNQMLEQLVCANPDFRQLYNGSDRQLAELTGVVDSFCLGKLHAKLFSGLRAIHSDDDATTLARMQRLAAAPYSVLGVPNEASGIDFSAAINLMRGIDAYISPLSKLEMLNEVQNIIAQALANSSRRDLQGMSTDDALPLMVLVTVRSAPQYLASTIAYITLFGHAETMPPHLSYQLTTLHALYEFITNADIGPSTLPAPAGGENGADPLDAIDFVKFPPRTVAEALAAHVGALSRNSGSAAAAAAATAATSTPTTVVVAPAPAAESSATEAAAPAAAPAAAAATAPVSDPLRNSSSSNNNNNNNNNTSKGFVRAPDVISMDDDPKHGLGEFLASLRQHSDVSSSSSSRK
jgi:hypothetical protein